MPKGAIQSLYVGGQRDRADKTWERAWSECMCMHVCVCLHMCVSVSVAIGEEIRPGGRGWIQVFLACWHLRKLKH